MLSNTREGAVVAFTNYDLRTISAFVPRTLLERELGSSADTPVIDDWLRQNASEVAEAVIACNQGQKPKPPFCGFRAKGQITVHGPKKGK